MTFTVKELAENITQQISSLRKVLDSGTYVNADDQFNDIERDCDVVVPKWNTYTHTEHSAPDPLESLVARGCNSVAENLQATLETVK